MDARKNDKLIGVVWTIITKLMKSPKFRLFLSRGLSKLVQKVSVRKTNKRR